MAGEQKKQNNGTKEKSSQPKNEKNSKFKQKMDFTNTHIGDYEIYIDKGPGNTDPYKILEKLVELRKDKTHSNEEKAEILRDFLKEMSKKKT